MAQRRSSASEYALLILYVKGGDCVCDDVAWYIGEDKLFEAIVNGGEPPAARDDEGVPVRIECTHELRVFPSEASQAAALKLARGVAIWLHSDDAQVSVHLRRLTDSELASYREHHRA
jgi:hypothetical protein